MFHYLKKDRRNAAQFIERANGNGYKYRIKQTGSVWRIYKASDDPKLTTGWTDEKTAYSLKEAQSYVASIGGRLYSVE